MTRGVVVICGRPESDNGVKGALNDAGRSAGVGLTERGSDPGR